MGFEVFFGFAISVLRSQYVFDRTAAVRTDNRAIHDAPEQPASTFRAFPDVFTVIALLLSGFIDVGYFALSHASTISKTPTPKPIRVPMAAALVRGGVEAIIGIIIGAISANVAISGNPLQPLRQKSTATARPCLWRED